MATRVIAVSDFIHGRIKMDKRGEATLPDQTAQDLKVAGLVVFAADTSADKAAPVASNKMATPARNKAKKLTATVGDAGAAQSADVCTNVGAPAGSGSEDSGAADAVSEHPAPVATD